MCIDFDNVLDHMTPLTAYGLDTDTIKHLATDRLKLASRNPAQIADVSQKIQQLRPSYLPYNKPNTAFKTQDVNTNDKQELVMDIGIHEIQNQICTAFLEPLEDTREWIAENNDRERAWGALMSQEANTFLLSNSKELQQVGKIMTQELAGKDSVWNISKQERIQGIIHDFSQPSRHLNQITPHLLNALIPSIASIMEGFISESHLGSKREQLINNILNRPAQGEEDKLTRSIFATKIAESLLPHLEKELYKLKSGETYITFKDYDPYPVLVRALKDLAAQSKSPDQTYSALEDLAYAHFPTKWDISLKYSHHESSKDKHVFYWKHSFEASTNRAKAQEWKRIHCIVIDTLTTE
jgi:hypothetical protein